MTYTEHRFQDGTKWVLVDDGSKGELCAAYRELWYQFVDEDFYKRGVVVERLDAKGE